MSSSKGKKSAGGNGPTIRTLADLSRQPSPSADSDSDSPKEYYTGGEKSGMLVQDPSKRNEVDDIFEQARQAGALEIPQPPLHAPSSSRTFTGAGRLLSGETVPPSATQPPDTVAHDINFWNNGFTVNDGPLRSFDDPEDASFLQCIKNSVCPKELEPSDRRTAVHFNLIKRNQDYQEPERPQLPFRGVGRTLGSGSLSSPAPSAGSSASARPTSFAVDESLPRTSLQIRLADGTRMVAWFNLHHTVGHVRAFIEASRPSTGTSFQLMVPGVPPKVLDDPAKTIEQEGLGNSVVVQRM